MKNTQNFTDIAFEDILAENRRRLNLLSAGEKEDYNSNEPIDIERCKTDFIYWAARAVTIRDKRTGRTVPFILNRAQRRVLNILEDMRRANRPIRVIMLKARHWGGSTLVQIYMTWIQLIHCRNWHSVICAHVKDTARTIRSMYSNLLASYPPELVKDILLESGADCADGKKTAVPKLEFVPFEGAQNVKIIKERACRVAIASAENQDAMRGADIAMAHLSEVAFWKATTLRDPEDFLRAVCSSVPLEPMTLIAIESTANGVGNFFHTEWMRATQKTSDKVAVFVPWYEIEMYTMEVADYRSLWDTMNAYEHSLWSEHGCTLEQINWYRHKLAEYPKPELMHAEFPTTPQEAFVSSDSNVFSNEGIEKLRSLCREPVMGEISKRKGFVADSKGELKLWEDASPGCKYIVTVDVGGRSAKSDWSVIAVMKYPERVRADSFFEKDHASSMAEVVAQWRGHIDHDLLAEKAMTLASRYNQALLVIESNTLESADESSESSLVLDRIAKKYRNVYMREGGGSASERKTGFHTNHRTKSLIINNLIEYVRETAYIERDEEACNELATYCRLQNGSYAARRGKHDDILMTRAIALHIISSTMAASAPALRDIPTNNHW